MRGDDIGGINGAAQGMQAMVHMQAPISDEEIEAVTHSVDHLGTMETPVVKQRPSTLEISDRDAAIPVDTRVQPIHFNQDRGACTWTVDGVEAEPVEIVGREIDARD